MQHTKRFGLIDIAGMLLPVLLAVIALAPAVRAQTSFTTRNRNKLQLRKMARPHKLFGRLWTKLEERCGFRNR